MWYDGAGRMCIQDLLYRATCLLGNTTLLKINEGYGLNIIMYAWSLVVAREVCKTASNNKLTCDFSRQC